MARRTSDTTKEDFVSYRDADTAAIPLTDIVRNALPLHTRESGNLQGFLHDPLNVWSRRSRRSKGFVLGTAILLGVLVLLRIKTTPQSTVPSLETDPLHPIQHLVASGNRVFDDLFTRQSETVAEAATEYQRRYGRRPPPGFGEWYALAQERGLFLIDEFDTMMANLEPFWGINPITMRERMQNMAEAPHVFSMTLNSTGFYNTTNYWQVDTVRGWLNDMPWQNIVHNVEFLLDTMDEPTISVSNEVLQEALVSASHQKSSIDAESPEILPADTETSWYNYKNTNTWKQMMSSCPPTDSAHGSPAAAKPDNGFPKFIANVSASMDPCFNPELHKIHGIWSSPVNLLLTKQLVPVFSQARPTRMNDILYPSPFYSLRMDDSIYEEDKDIPWDEKLDRAYWVGTGNGGMSTLENWRLLQRQRMALLTEPDNTDPVALLRPSFSESGAQTGWERRPDTLWSDLAKYFHIRIAEVAVCEPEACKVQEAHFKPQREPASGALESKYVLDIDGMSFSGRYYRLLKSNCAVLKQTVLEEWHDGWLVPWVHYIPVSLAADELGEIMRFLVEDPAGQEIGRNIALQGKNWARKVLRKEDLELVFLRLLMEFERLSSVDRNDLYYVAP